MARKGRRKKVRKDIPIYDEERNMILQFRGEYEFLSNFYECPNGVEFEGLIYPTSENAYQAAKVHDFRRKIFTQITPKEAKKLGRKYPMRYEMKSPETRIKVMKQILRNKFKRNPELKQKLLETGDVILVEGNTWNDTFWGVDLNSPCNNCEYGYEGKNMLGKLLMELREEFKSKTNKNQ